MIFEESDLRFEFDPQRWEIIQYDLTKDFLNIRDAISGTKGVDFIGIKDNQLLAIIEVKNFRGYRIKNKPRIEQGDDPLDVEFALKVKDSIAGLIGGVRNSTNDLIHWRSCLEILKSQKRRVELVVWLEEDVLSGPKADDRKRRLRNTFLNDLKKGGKWLTNRVFIANRNTNPYSDSLTVHYL